MKTGEAFGLSKALAVLLLIICAAAVSPGARIAEAQQAALKVEAGAGGAMRVKPGELRTMSFKVSNMTGGAVSAAANVDAPDGWQSVISPQEFELGAGQSRTVFVTLAVREFERAGAYSLTFEAYPKDNPAAAARAGVQIEVEAMARLGLIASPMNPSEVAAREDYTLAFTLTNHGNAPVEVRLGAESNLDWKTQVQPERMELEPGEAGGVQIAVSVPNKMAEVASHRVTLTASGSADGRAMETATAASTARVIPVTLEKSMYASIDGAVKVLSEWQGGDIGRTQAAIELGGDLGGGRRGEVYASAPINRGDFRSAFGTFGADERVTVLYSDEGWGYAAAGDISSGTVSPLLRQNLSGRGVDVFGRLGHGTGIRTFFNRSRGTLVSVETKGVQVEQAIGKNAHVKLTGVQSSDVSAPEGYTRPLDSMTAYSAYAAFEPAGGLSFEAEAAASHDGPEGSDGAYRLVARYKTPGLALGAEMVHAGSNFLGAWRDVEIRRGNFSYQVAKGLNLWGNISSSRRNVDMTPELPAADEDSFAAGATFGLGAIGKGRITWREDGRKDVNLGTFDIDTATAEYEVSKSWRNSRLAVTLRDRRRTDNVTGEVEDSDSIRLYGGIRIGKKASFNFSATKTRDNSGGETKNTTQMTLGSNFSVSKNTDLNLDYQRNEHANIGATSWANAAVIMRMSGGSVLSARMRHTSGAFGNDTTIGVELAYPLSIPVKSVAKGGRLVGRIFYAHSPETGVADCVVGVAGMQVVTDESGAFAFPLLPAGAHEISVSTARLGVGLVPELTMPHEFTVEQGETVEIEISVVRSASLSGAVTIEKRIFGAKPEAVPAADVIVELVLISAGAGADTEAGAAESGKDGDAENLETGGAERKETGDAVAREKGGAEAREKSGAERKIFRLTDTRGRYAFSGLTPGEYEVRVWKDGLPRFTAAYPASHRVTLAPGDALAGLDFAIKNVEREIEVTAVVGG